MTPIDKKKETADLYTHHARRYYYIRFLDPSGERPFQLKMTRPRVQAMSQGHARVHLPARPVDK